MAGIFPYLEGGSSLNPLKFIHDEIAKVRGLAVASAGSDHSKPRELVAEESYTEPQSVAAHSVWIGVCTSGERADWSEVCRLP